ncbi:unnamed protein product [Rotaria socialis]|uniref:Uncharacterized protein n=1 Tax=Rotaria socialis TaxID=392032 RepID=A0A821ZL45_9BILA|nr:unnamed protein product [Rotaria socialis]
MNRTHIKHNSERYGLHDRWKQHRVEGWIKQIRSQHQFDPIGIKKVECRRTSCSGNIETNEVNNQKEIKLEIESVQIPKLYRHSSLVTDMKSLKFKSLSMNFMKPICFHT